MTMAFRYFFPIIIGTLHIVACMPAITLEDLEDADDTQAVGSYVREVRAASPYRKSYENEGDGEIGYSRKKSGGGKKGYQHFDTYHKKAGDNFEFEKQDSFGLDNDGEKGTHGDHHEGHEHHEEKAEQYREPYSDAENEQVEQVEHKGNGDHQKKANAALQHEHSEHSYEGDEGGDASGHDPADYTLPDKYSYGEGDEYNFRK